MLDIQFEYAKLRASRAFVALHASRAYVSTWFTYSRALRAFSVCVPLCLCLLRVLRAIIFLCVFIFLSALGTAFYVPYVASFFSRALCALIFYVPYPPSFFNVPYVP